MAPMSNSFPLKNDSGGGAGVMTCFEGTSGPPAKQVTACEARATTAKATTFFIMLGSHFSLMDRDSTIISTTQRAEGTTPDRGRYTAGVSFRVEPAYGTLVA